ncbi:hypothetical protein ACFCV8_13840 [Streptomyces sp. NPDC056347]|uniref:DUF7224 domain-containing protein n=1 Tax=Streptomyces sp. NPDC056347 TaxID=3345790 RepID=UPI0035E2E1B4
MITWANLRASAAPWLVLPILVYAALYIDDATFTAPSGYGVESGELVAHAVAVIAPAVAAAAAWEAGRHRLLAALTSTGQRSAARQLLRAVTPVLILLFVLVLGALVVARRATGVLPGGEAGWLAVAHLIVLSLGWMVIGWCLGLMAPRSIAAPSAGVVCWAWLSMPHAMSNSWMRHLGGFIDGLSTVTDVVTPAVYVVPWCFVAGLALAFWLLARIRQRVLAVVIACAVVAVTFVVGRASVIDWGFQNPTSPRNVAVVCVGQAPRVCVPPEYEPYAGQLRQDALSPLARLKSAGVVAPAELRIASADVALKPGTWPLFWSPPPRGGTQEPAEYAANLAESAVTGTAALAGVRDCRQPGSTPAAWAALVTGVDEQGVKTALPPAEWSTLQKIRRLPAAEQADWFAKAAADQKHCGEVLS